MHLAIQVSVFVATAFYAIADDCKPPSRREVDRVATYLSWRNARSGFKPNVACCEMEFTRVNNTIYIHALDAQVVTFIDMDPSVAISEFSWEADGLNWKDQVVRFANPEVPPSSVASSRPNSQPFIVCRWPAFTVPQWKPLAKSARPTAFNAIRRALGLRSADNDAFVVDVIAFYEQDPYIVGVISRLGTSERSPFWGRLRKTADRWTFVVFRQGFESDLIGFESLLASKGSWRVR